MNLSELIEKVAQTTELDQAAADQAVKPVVNAILGALSAGEPVRVAGFGVFDVAARPARQGRNPRTGETIAIAASKAVRFHAGKAVKDSLNLPPKGGSRKKTAPPKKSAVRKPLQLMPPASSNGFGRTHINALGLGLKSEQDRGNPRRYRQSFRRAAWPLALPSSPFRGLDRETR